MAEIHGEKIKRIIPFIILAAVIIAGIYLFLRLMPQKLEASGTIEVDEARVASKVTGRIEWVIEEGAKIEKGDVIAKLTAPEIKDAYNQAAANYKAVVKKAKAAKEQVKSAEALAAQAEKRVSLTDASVDAGIGQAKAAVDVSSQRLQALQSGLRVQEVKQARENMDAAEAAYTLSKKSIERSRNIYEAGAISKSELDMAQSNYDSSKARYEAARAAYSMAESGYRKESVREGEASYQGALAGLASAQAGLYNKDISKKDLDAAKAKLTSAKREAEAANYLAQQALAAMKIAGQNVKETVIYAPYSGFVTKKIMELGDLAVPGSVIVTMADLEKAWVTVYLPETQVGRIKLQDPADVTVDSYPGKKFSGKVTFISQEAEFTPKFIQTKEERVTLTFRVKVTVDNKDLMLKPGLPADVRIHETGPGGNNN
ncbi:MAG: efflux RND transporter periplasmic adaptor subunit [Chloroflexi bacterium]|nr:efflux RND transporter periplasmic adaptor subunit [Chloroflexota bacterium]